MKMETHMQKGRMDREKQKREIASFYELQEGQEEMLSTFYDIDLKLFITKL